jgi:RimJ/RimL family protein N-acetyltransferase
MKAAQSVKWSLRKPEPRDAPALYSIKNDQQISSMLGGFNTGYSIADIERWIEIHNGRTDEVLWIIADRTDDRCLGHVGLYKIDYRAGNAEFAILLGDRELWGKGIGKAVTREVLDFAFKQLHLHRVYLTVLERNARAVKLYESLGFEREGCLRDAQFKDGAYLDLICFAIIEDKHRDARKA